MKKLVVATCTALLLSFGLTVTNLPILSTTVEAKTLEYSIYLSPGGTYQLGYGSGYKYHAIQGGFKTNFTVSSGGLVTASTNPSLDGNVGEIWVVDRYGNSLELVQVYIR